MKVENKKVGFSYVDTDGFHVCKEDLLKLYNNSLYGSMVFQDENKGGSKMKVDAKKVIKMQEELTQCFEDEILAIKKRQALALEIERRKRETEKLDLIAEYEKLISDLEDKIECLTDENENLSIENDDLESKIECLTEENKGLKDAWSMETYGYNTEEMASRVKRGVDEY